MFHVYKYMFLTPERPETDDYERRKNLVGKDKCLREISILQEMTKRYKILKTP